MAVQGAAQLFRDPQQDFSTGEEQHGPAGTNGALFEDLMGVLARDASQLSGLFEGQRNQNETITLPLARAMGRRMNQSDALSLNLGFQVDQCRVQMSSKAAKIDQAFNKVEVVVNDIQKHMVEYDNNN